MTVYILLFRGVGGATQLPVKPLREKLTAAGFDNVATYINSGNAVLKSRLGKAKVIAQVADICRREFGFDKDIHAPTLDEWRGLIAANPFPQATDTPKFLHAAVLAREPAEAAVAKVRSHAVGGERFEVRGMVAYLYTPDGFGRSKMAERFDRDIGVPNTARNWNTVTKLKELAEAAA